MVSPVYTLSSFEFKEHLYLYTLGFTSRIFLKKIHNL